MTPTWLRSHDDALDLLRYAVPGALIELAPTRARNGMKRALLRLQRERDVLLDREVADESLGTPVLG